MICGFGEAKAKYYISKWSALSTHTRRTVTRGDTGKIKNTPIISQKALYCINVNNTLQVCVTLSNWLNEGQVNRGLCLSADDETKSTLKLKLNSSYWVFFMFEKTPVRRASSEEIIFFLQRYVLWREALITALVSILKGTQVHTSTAGDWPRDVLFVVSEILIALSKVTEKE